MLRQNFFVRGEDDILNSALPLSLTFKQFSLELDSGTAPVDFFYQKIGDTAEVYFRGLLNPTVSTNTIQSTVSIPFEVIPNQTISSPVVFFSNPGFLRIDNAGIVTFILTSGNFSDSPVLGPNIKYNV